MFMFKYLEGPGWWKAESKCRHALAAAAVVALVAPGTAAAVSSSPVKQMHGHKAPGGIKEYVPTPAGGGAILRD